MIKASAVITFNSKFLLEGESLAMRLSVPHIDAIAEDIIKKPDIISYLRSRCDIGQSKLKALLVYLNNGLYIVQVTMD